MAIRLYNDKQFFTFTAKKPMTQVKRPLSPHLGIYRPQISTVLSILNRATGLALYAGSLLMVLWLWSAAYAPEFYATLHQWLATIIGKLLLLGWTAAFYFHLVNGIRHLVWDTGRALSIPAVNSTGVAAVIVTLILTAFTWGVAISAGVQ